MGIKVTEMTEATQVNNNDLFMIVQNGENKKITKETLQDSIVDAELEERVDTLEDNVEDLQDEVEALQEENEYLNSLVEQAFDKKEVEGEELSINDTINAKMEVDLLGNTKQETTTGKNKLRYPYNETTKTQNGITFTDNSNGSITINGTSTSATYFNFRANTTEDRQKLSSGTYTFSVAQALPNGVSLSIGFRDSEGNPISGLSTITLSTNTRTATVTINQAVEIFGFISISSGVTISNYIVKPQLEEGSTASSYEKYTGGNPAPNPDYPQEVHTVTGDNTIVVSNKNLFDKNNLTNNYRLDSNGQPYADNGYALTDYIKVQPNTQYTRNIDFAWNVPICLYDINKNFISRIQTGKTITTTNDTYYVRTDVAIADIDITQLEINSTVTPHTPHQEQTFQINLGTIELCKIGDYQDYFYKSNNKWYLHKQIGKVVLDGNTTGSIRTDIQNENTICFRTDAGVTNILTNSKPITNYFTAINDVSDVEHIRYIGASGYRFQLFVLKTTATTANEVIAWLSTHNTIIYYPLATPTDTEITDTTLISQLEALKTAMSYAEQTNISQINDDVPFILKVTALASYNSRILALENAILNANRSTPVENTRKSNEVIEEPKEEVTEKEEVVEPKEENKEER